MTRKQLRNLAKEVYQCESIHADPSSSEEEKYQAEVRLMKLTKQIMCLKNGLDILSQIDELVIQLAEQNVI